MLDGTLERGSGGAVRPAIAPMGRATTPRAQARSAPSASTRARGWRSSANCSAARLTGTGATAPNRRFANGMLAIYIDPKVVDPANFFDGEISRYVDFIRATKPVAGVEPC